MPARARAPEEKPWGQAGAVPSGLPSMISGIFMCASASAISAARVALRARARFTSLFTSRAAAAAARAPPRTPALHTPALSLGKALIVEIALAPPANDPMRAGRAREFRTRLRRFFLRFYSSGERCCGGRELEKEPRRIGEGSCWCAYVCVCVKVGEGVFW